MNAPTTRKQTLGWPLWSKVLSAVLTVAFVVFVMGKLPGTGYPTDLSRVGAGRPALVLALDSNYAGGAAVMELMNKIREDYADRVEFLVAHLAMADGQEFARRHDAADGTVLLFAGDGRHVGALHHPKQVDELRQALNQALGQ